MSRTLFIITFITISLSSFAKGNDTNSEIKPKQTVKTEAKSFSVHGLKACTGEYNDADALGTFEDKPTTSTTKEVVSKETKETE